MSASLALQLLLLAQEREREEQRIREECDKRIRERDELAKKRKNAPVVYNDENWQRERCLKVISMQSCVQKLIDLIDKLKIKVYKKEEKRYDDQIMNTYHEYNSIRYEIQKLFDELERQGIVVSGKQIKLTCVSPSESAIPKPEKTVEKFGSIFTLNNNRPINISPEILNDANYYKIRYLANYHDTIKCKISKLESRKQKYERYGSVFKFLLKTCGYKRILKKLEEYKKNDEAYEKDKNAMETFDILLEQHKDQIDKYYENINRLTNVSNRIESLFKEKEELDLESTYIYDLTIKEILGNPEYKELILETSEYIDRICSNDEETMKEAFELVKGEYPIELTRKDVYDLIFKNVIDQNKETVKELKHSN